MQLEEAERRASTTARELQRVGALLAADLDPRAVLRQIVAQAVSLLGADACALRLLEEDELVLRAAEGAPVESLGGERLPVSDVLAAEVLATSRPVALDDLAADGRLAPDDPVLLAGFASWAGAPIASADGGVQGMLAIFGRHPRRLRDDEVEALAAFANSASVALRNALLYEAVADEKDRVAADPRARRRRDRRDGRGRPRRALERRRRADHADPRAPRAQPGAGRAAVERARRRRRHGAAACSRAQARSRPRCGSRAPARSCGCRSRPRT